MLLLLTVGCRSLSSNISEADRAPTESAPTGKRTFFAFTNRGSYGEKPTVAEKAGKNRTKIAEASEVLDHADVSPVEAQAETPSKQMTRHRRGVARDARTAEYEATDADSPDAAIEVAKFQDTDLEQVGVDPRKPESPQPLEWNPERAYRDVSISIPAEIPGATAPRHRLPPRRDDDDMAGRILKFKVIDLLFPPRGEPAKIEEPSGQVMTLEDLEQLALENNPILVQARAAITISEGGAIQAGIYPNPTFGYESDTVGSSFTRNYQGIYVQQPIKTAGKLPLARAIANVDVMNAQLGYNRTKQEILRSIRSGYYNVLVAHRTVRFNEAFERMTRQVYEAMKERLKGGEHPVFELDQYNSLVTQARATLVQSQNRYISAWKQLAVSTGIPQLKPTVLEGPVDLPVPNLDYSVLLDRALAIHPDLYAARNLEQQAQTHLKLQRALVVPDVTVAGVFQNDFTTPGFNRTSYNLNVSVPVPLFDRNQGNIKSALGRLQMMAQQNSVKTMELTTQLADAFERFQTGRYEAEAYRTQVLPDQVRAYEGVYTAYVSDNPDVAFGDIVLAQQNLANGVATYVSTLLGQWIALTDIANLLQLQDFRELLNEDSPLVKGASAETPPPVPQEGGRP